MRAKHKRREAKRLLKFHSDRLNIAKKAKNNKSITNIISMIGVIKRYIRKGRKDK